MNEQLKQIAERIKELREIENLSEADMAEKLGIATDEYIKYETTESDLPISTLYTIAHIFGVDATVIMTGDIPRMNTCTVTRAGHGVNIKRFEGYKYSALAYNFMKKIMEPMLVELEASDQPPEAVTHSGQEFNIVLSGNVIIRVGTHEYVLNEGDSIYFDPRLPHYQFTKDTNAKFLTIITE